MEKDSEEGEEPEYGDCMRRRFTPLYEGRVWKVRDGDSFSSKHRDFSSFLYSFSSELEGILLSTAWKLLADDVVNKLS